MKKINVLDCTLRDGGYYNNWKNFSKDLVNDYLKAISDSGIKYVELGFRSLKQNKFNGANFFTTDSYIESLNIPKKLKLVLWSTPRINFKCSRLFKSNKHSF